MFIDKKSGISLANESDSRSVVNKPPMVCKAFQSVKSKPF